MKTDIWKAAKLLLAQLLKLDINEQLSREVDYLKVKNQVKYDSSKVKRKPGRPKVDVEIEQLVLKFVKENRSWDTAGLLEQSEISDIRYLLQR